jgi:hypothetical protein
MEQKNAIQIIKSRKSVNGPGIYELRATSVVPFIREDGTPTTIVNLNGMTQYHQAEAKRLAEAGDLQGAVNQNLSVSLLQGKYVPSPGEMVQVVVEEITTKNDVRGLFVTSLSKIKATVTSNVSFDLVAVGNETL